MDMQQRILELERKVKDQQANLELAWQTINLQSQIIKSIKDDGSDDDLTFLTEVGLTHQPSPRAS